MLIGIGLKGGIEFSHAHMRDAVIVALVLGFGLPIVAYAILLGGRLDKLNASAIAAHYGSVSAGTFLTAIAYLNAQDMAYETYPVIMLAIMESPASSSACCSHGFARRRTQGRKRRPRKSHGRATARRLYQRQCDLAFRRDVYRHPGATA